MAHGKIRSALEMSAGAKLNPPIPGRRVVEGQVVARRIADGKIAGIFALQLLSRRAAVHRFLSHRCRDVRRSWLGQIEHTLLTFSASRNGADPATAVHRFAGTSTS